VTREHWKTVILGAIAAGLVVVLAFPLSTVSVHVEMPSQGASALPTPPPVHNTSPQVLALAYATMLGLVVTIVLIVWIVRRCLRHLADSRKPDLADIF
jgi:hypothetical protein